MNELKKMNVYDVDTVLENALLYGVDQYGEVLTEEQINELVEQSEMTITNKLEYMGKIVINTESFEEAIDKEIEKLKAKKEMVKRGRQRTADYVDKFIRYTFTDKETGELDFEGLNKFKLKSPSINLSYRKSESVEVIDEQKVPKKYKDVVVSEKVSKTKLKEYLNTLPKRECKYAKIKTNLNLSIK